VFGEMLGSVKGHFGPINTLAFSPDGQGYVSGGEEGYIRAHRFDPSYFDFEFEY
jgi:translation initiation factor 3 subunit I